MKEQFLKEENPQSDGETISQLLIYTEEDGNVYFSCDWTDSEDAVTSMGSMLYRLSEGQLVSEIMDNLKSQCVLEERIEDYEKISTLYNSLKILKKSVNEISEDTVVVNPIDATTF
mgnify:FL=1|tara:strand:+ start:2966 stop:3313 length:348 start_codon:yes stop_codon:yes gene_type:complete